MSSRSGPREWIFRRLIIRGGANSPARFVATETASGPETRIIATPALPGAVANAKIVSRLLTTALDHPFPSRSSERYRNQEEFAMVRRVAISEFGGPEVMKIVEGEAPRPGEGEVSITHEVIGLNFIDTYHRSGLYPMPLPTGIGLEAAGVVAEVGPGVTGFKAGDRVGYCSGPIGAYSEVHVVKAERLIKLPDGVESSTAAASMLKGLTVQYLIRQIYRVRAGETVLFHAAAGGVGLIATQWLKHIGATVIGTVGSEQKAELARKAGCDHVIRYDHEDVAAHVKDITDGAMVPVVFDGVGASTWESSLNSLKKRGMMISFGNASGPVTNVNLGTLAAKGSLFVTLPTLFDYTSTRAELDDASKDFFGALAEGAIKVDINAEYALDDVVTAHRDLEARKTTGSTILRP